MDYDLQRFLKAQDAPYSGYADALAEIRQGRKRSHWIWYVFPQMKGLGHSFNSGYYGISCRGEAEAYIGDAVLGARLREVAGALLAVEGRSAREILGGIDALKVTFAPSSPANFTSVSCPQLTSSNAAKAAMELMFFIHVFFNKIVNRFY